MALGHIEPISGVLRIGGAYGEPYTWAASLRYLSPTAVEVLGISRPPTRYEWRQAVAVFVAVGIREFRFTRVKDAIVRWHVKRAITGEQDMAYSDKQALADVKQAFSADVRPKTNPRQAVKAALAAIADDIEAGLDAEKAQNDAAYKAGKAAIKARRAGIGKAVADIFAGTE